MSERIGGKARVFDFDDTIIKRETVTRLSGLVFGKLRPNNLPNLTLSEIARLNLNHKRTDTLIITFKELLSFKTHARRNVFPQVEEEFKISTREGVAIYGNTGRSNKAEWVGMTEETLQRGKVFDYFKDIFYTPDGVRTAVSKAHVIQLLLGKYEEIEFYEDDPRTVKFIALLFPSVKINFIQNKTTGLLVSQKELEQFPNVTRVAAFM